MIASWICQQRNDQKCAVHICVVIHHGVTGALGVPLSKACFVIVAMPIVTDARYFINALLLSLLLLLYCYR